jgi:RimJ/RimL family protein N-acetyltransferase
VVVGQDARVGPWVCERTNGEYSSGSTIGLEVAGELVAGVLFDNYNGTSVCIHVASDGTKRWLNREFLWFTFHYAFNQLKVKKLVGPVPASNAAALKFDLNLGFVEEARITDACEGGDLIFLTMTREQCRFLESRK